MLTRPHSWIEINKSAFENNVAIYKKIINNKKLAAIIKSNAYGHGIYEIASLCDVNDSIDCLCVSGLTEALYLRSAGIKKNILVMSYIDDYPELAVGKNIEFMISDVSTAQELNRVAIFHNSSFNIHLKVDTGLSRLGFNAQAIISDINILKNLSHVCITGLATHFAESNADDLSYTLYQRDLFYSIYTTLVSLGFEFIHVHASNTAAASAIDLSFCTMFRIGAGLYGIWPSKSNKEITQKLSSSYQLQQIITWKTKLILIKQIEATQSVGYSRTHVTQRLTTIGLVPIGYYDGFNFNLFNTGAVLIKGKLAPIIGRISMNLMTIDITDIANAEKGEEVELLGNHPGITLEDMGEQINSINIRELVTKINPLLNRIIVNKQIESPLAIHKIGEKTLTQHEIISC